MNAPNQKKKRDYTVNLCELHKDLILKMSADGCFLNEIVRATGAKSVTIHKYLRKWEVDRHFPYGLPGKKCVAWKRGWTINKDGYKHILMKNHPHAAKYTGYVLEHRLVMEQMIGRYLLPREVVHHRDGDKLNNAPENLQLFSENGEHLAFELKGRCPKWTPEGKARILASVLRQGGRQLHGSRKKLKPYVPE